MLIALDYLVKKYQLKIRGVLQIGAHYGQEYLDYVKQKVRDMVFFEPAALSYAELKKTLPESESVLAFKLALGNEVGEKEMYTETANHGMSNSLLEPGMHLKQYPLIKFEGREKVQVERLDNVKFDRSLYNMINIDVQGYELEVFKGAVKTLKTIDIIYTEVNFDEVYKGCVHVEELDIFLRKFGFIRIFTNNKPRTWGDALYLKYE